MVGRIRNCRTQKVRQNKDVWKNLYGMVRQDTHKVMQDTLDDTGHTSLGRTHTI